MPGDEPVEYAPPVDADGQGRLARLGKAPIGAFPRRSGRRPSRTIRTWRRPLEHVTVADAYRIREEAADSRPGSDRGGVDIIAAMPLTAQGRPWGIGRIFLLLRSGHAQPERPRGADPEVTPWFHALDQKRVVRSGVAQVLSTIFAAIQTVLWSQLKFIFYSNLTFNGRDIRVARNVVFASSRWLPRIGSASSDEIGGAWQPRCASSRCRCSETHRARVGARPWSWSSAGGSPDALVKAGVALVVLKENIRVGGKHDIPTKVMVTTLVALFAEVERDLISERTREGLARARASGRKLGRPKRSLGVSRLDGKEDESRRFLELGVSTAIAKLTAVSRTTLYSFMNTHGRRAGSHAPAPWPGRDCTGQRRLAAQPVRPQDARRRVPAAVTGPPPRSSAGNATR